MRFIQERNTNELNIFTYDYLPWSYWKNWFRNIGQFFRNIKYAWQRATKGFSDRDVWNLDNYYLQLFYHTLKHLAKNTMGYPGTGEFSDEKGGFDAWQKYISDMADHFENAEEWNEEVSLNLKVKEAYEKVDSYISSRDFVPCDDGSGCSKLEYKYLDKEAHDKAEQEWLELEKKAVEYREKEKDKGFNMMKKHFFDLWD